MVRDKLSEWAPVTSGVPQGSVLRPVLFLVYASDMTEVIDSEVSLFADDMKLMRRIQTDEDQVGIQRDVDGLQAWSSNWLLEFNPTKCNFMKIREGQRRPQTEYKLEGKGYKAHSRKRILE